MTQVQLIKYENPGFTTGTRTLTLDSLLGHLWGSGQALQGKTAARVPHTPPLSTPRGVLYVNTENPTHESICWTHWTHSDNGERALCLPIPLHLLDCGGDALLSGKNTHNIHWINGKSQ